MSRKVTPHTDKVVVTQNGTEIAIFPVGAGIEEEALARAMLFRAALDHMDAVEMFGVAGRAVVARTRGEMA